VSLTAQDTIFSTVPLVRATPKNNVTPTSVTSKLPGKLAEMVLESISRNTVPTRKAPTRAIIPILMPLHMERPKMSTKPIVPINSKLMRSRFCTRSFWCHREKFVFPLDNPLDRVQCVLFRQWVLQDRAGGVRIAQALVE